MIFKDDSDSAALYLKSAVAKMLQHNIVSNPFNLTLWYCYYSGSFPELNTELDYIIDRYNTCPDEECELLLYKYIFKTDCSEDKDLGLFQQAMEKLLGKITDGMKSSSSQSDTFISKLKCNLADLSSTEMDDKLRQALQSLNLSTNSLCQVNEALNKKLLSAQVEVSSLRSQLALTTKLSNTDALTGLSNRRFFEASYYEFIENQEHPVVSLILMDIDKFKNFNDSYGHQMGDNVLRLVGKLLISECNQPYIPIRFGGEEFVVLCLDVDVISAERFAESLRVKLSNIKLKSAKNDIRLPQITASFGVAQYRKGDLLELVTSRADAALYKAKDSGRNQVISSR